MHWIRSKKAEKRNQKTGFALSIRTAGVALAVTALVLGGIAPASALQLYEGDAVTVSLDSTLSYGLMWRVAKRDQSIIGIGNGGEKYSGNYDDGNLNYDRGLVSNLVKINTELDIAAENYGLFARGKAFYDYENMENDRTRTPLTDEAKDKVGAGVDLLDAYIWGAVDIGSMPVQLRVGEQVVSWGESTFIQGGINAINPIDVAAIRGPGAELKEALLPEGLVYLNAGLTDNISLEGVYLYDWGETELEPRGTYFSTIDFASPGSYKLVLGSGQVPDGGEASVADTFLGVPRGETYEARDDGQFGVGLRVYSPELNDTEFGFFYINYHNRLPNLSARTGTEVGVADAMAVLSTTGSLPAALSTYVKTIEYRTEYVEDIQLYGLSAATEILGYAVQGEYSYKVDAPLQIDDAELLLHILGPLDGALGAPLSSQSQLGSATAFEQDVDGYILRDISQAQMTITKLFGPTLGGDAAVTLAEFGITHVHGMPSKDELRLEGPGTVTPGSAGGAAALEVPAEPADTFADATSWGYRLLAKVDYNNLIGPISISPRIAWAHDVNGNSTFGGPFQEGKRSISLGIGASYQSWTADVSYTNFFGVEDYNWVNDRDFVACNVKYSF